MSLHFSRLWRVREGKLEKFKDWMRELSTGLRDEAIATFTYEHVDREVFVLFKGADGTDYVIGFNETSTEHRPSDPSVTINQKHAMFKQECLEPISEKGEILLDLP